MRCFFQNVAVCHVILTLEFPNTLKHCLKSVRIWSYSDPYFPAFGLNTDQNNFEYGHFLRTESC